MVRNTFSVDDRTQAANFAQEQRAQVADAKVAIELIPTGGLPIPAPEDDSEDNRVHPKGEGSIQVLYLSAISKCTKELPRPIL